MKNYEEYAEVIKNYADKDFCRDFIRPYILKTSRDDSSCAGMDCSQCPMVQNIWLLEEYEEPEVDWSKVEVDTPILVKDFGNKGWEKAYFAKYEDGDVRCWNGGRTSWNESITRRWAYAKLAETEGAE